MPPLLPPRDVPIPGGVSEDFRASLESFPSASAIERPEPPQTAAEWRSLQAQRNGQRAAVVKRALERCGVTAAEETISGTTVARLSPAQRNEERAGCTFVYLHGGAYVFGAGDAGWNEGILIADRLGVDVLSVDYPMPPDHPFPAAIEAVVGVYGSLLENMAPGSIIIGGTSAGAGLALAVGHRLCESGTPMPGAFFAGSPWTDLTRTGDTLFTNEGLDRILGSYEGVLSAAAKLYANGNDPMHPLLSPIYGDFAAFPPTMLVSGTRDLFLSDVVRAHRKLRAAGVLSDLHVFEAMSHADYLSVPDSPESRELYDELARFVDLHLKEISAPSSSGGEKE